MANEFDAVCGVCDVREGGKREMFLSFLGGMWARAHCLEKKI